MKSLKKYLPFLLPLIPFGIIAFLLSLTHGKNVALLNSHGFISLQQRSLLLFMMGLGLSVAIPILIVLFVVAFTYRASSNTKRKHAPDWVANPMIQALWWAFLTGIILISSTVTWITAHSLDPYKNIPSNNPTLTIQVVALRWKWLFIYPKEHIASVNYMVIPVNTPVNFLMTADDTPMNSFWIPNLGGQMYTMSGMTSHLHLMATSLGEFPGSAAEINGEGLAGMRFVAKSVTQSDYDAWVVKTRKGNKPLNETTYTQLAQPSQENPPQFYSSVAEDLYSTILMKYMAPTGENLEQ